MAANVCYWIWMAGREWAESVREASPEAFLAGLWESGLATAAGVISMPILLWAGMRILRERANHALVMVGTVLWLFVGGHVVEDGVSIWGTAVFLTLFVILASLLALVKLPDQDGNSSS
ncbi:hypothetical protein [Streptomyces spiralis]|uniref:hypothetical protein n=1 Tax=Streptomyces spiralis TaxID=66376 RepID=UPI00367AA5A9